MRHLTDFNAEQVIAMLAPVSPGMNLDRLATLIAAERFPVFDYVERGEPYWYASTVAMYMVQFGRALGFNIDGAALTDGMQGLEDGEQT